jgi:hypothetical protein
MFFGKARIIPEGGAPERCFSLIVSVLTRKHYTRLERLARDKHSSFFEPFVSYKENEVL